VSCSESGGPDACRPCACFALLRGIHLETVRRRPLLFESQRLVESPAFRISILVDAHQKAVLVSFFAEFLFDVTEQPRDGLLQVVGLLRVAVDEPDVVDLQVVHGENPGERLGSQLVADRIVGKPVVLQDEEGDHRAVGEQSGNRDPGSTYLSLDRGDVPVIHGLQHLSELLIAAIPGCQLGNRQGCVPLTSPLLVCSGGATIRSASSRWKQ